MKKALFFVIIGIIACRKDNDTFHSGNVSALMNGVTWEAELYAITNAPNEQGFDILMDNFDKNDFQLDDLFIYKIPLKIGKTPLFRTEVDAIDSLTGTRYFTLEGHGDILGDGFHLIEDDNIEDFVEITKINDNKIEGNFQMSFVKDTTLGEVEPAVPDTIIFTNGVFKTRIVQ